MTHPNDPGSSWPPGPGSQQPYGSPSYGQQPYGVPDPHGWSPYGARPGPYAVGPDGRPYWNPLGPPPDDYMVWAILATVLCCLPLGVVAIVKAGDVKKRWARGDAEGARRAAAAARTWSIWSAAVIVVFVLVAIGAAVVDAVLTQS